ncbi:MAG: sulfatase family protein [Planctomycetota bacterium]|jgi:arylsulfatase A-like enzyme
MADRSSNSSLTRRDLLRYTTGGVAASVLGGYSGFDGGWDSGKGSKGSRPNVLVIFDDQLRNEACSIYGGRNITTPNMERLARGGMTFNNATSTCPLCTPYRGMLQTGRYPTHSGLVLNWVEPNPNQRCIAHVFRDAGYDPGFIGKWHLAAGVKKKDGYQIKTKQDVARVKRIRKAYLKENPETEYVPPGPQRLGYDHWQAFNFHCDFNNYNWYEDEPKKMFSEGYETDVQTDQTIEFMKQRQQAGKAFLVMMAPHPPHPPFDPKWCPKDYLEQIPKELHWLPNVPEHAEHRKHPGRARCYYSMCKNMDDNLGRILDYLDRSGLSENTIVVMTSDHGEMLGSQNRENKMVPYAEAVNIPLIVRWCGHILAGARTNVLHTPMDHMTTLSSLAGLSVPDTADGADVSDVLLGKSKSGRDAILMANYVSHWDYFETGTRWPEWRGVRTERYTYCRWLTGKEELYDSLEDPYQMRDLVKGQKDLPTLKKLRSRLKDLLADAHDEFLPGNAYSDWYDGERNLVKTSLGPV